MDNMPNCGADGCGAGGGNRMIADGVAKQHSMHDANSMMSKDGMMPMAKLPNMQTPSQGNPTNGAPGRRNFSRPLD